MSIIVCRFTDVSDGVGKHTSYWPRWNNVTASANADASAEDDAEHGQCNRSFATQEKEKKKIVSIYCTIEL